MYNQCPGKKTYVGVPTGYTRTYSLIGDRSYDLSITSMNVLTSTGDFSVKLKSNVAAGLAGGNKYSNKLFLTYDTKAPILTVSMPNNPVNQFPLVFLFSFDEPVKITSTSVSHISVSNLSTILSNQVTYVCADSAGLNVYGMCYAWTCNISPTGTFPAAASITLTPPLNHASDKASYGNTRSSSTALTLTLDGKPPVPTIALTAGQLARTRTPPVSFTVTFDEKVDASSVTPNIMQFGTSGNLSPLYVSNVIPSASSPGLVFEVQVSGMLANAITNVSLIVPAQITRDMAGIRNIASTNTVTVVFDTADLTVTVEQNTGQVDPVNVNVVYFNVTFNKDVTNFVASSLKVSASDTAVTLTNAITSSWTNVFILKLTLSSVTNPVTVTAQVLDSVVKDVAGNFNKPSTSVDNKITVDMVKPRVTINVPALSLSSPVTVGLLFDEPVTMRPTDINASLSGLGITSQVLSGSGTNYQLQLSFMGTGALTVTVLDGKAKDLAGNTIVGVSATGLYDMSTVAPLLIEPLDGAVLLIGRDVVKFTIPELPYPDSIVLSFVNGTGYLLEILLGGSSAGDKQLQIDFSNLAADGTYRCGGVVCTSGGLVPGTTYNTTISYKDQYNHAVASSPTVSMIYGPSIESIVGGTNLPTTGGTKITLNGKNFGLISAANVDVTYRASGYDTYNCSMVSASSTQIVCNSAAGLGSGLVVTVSLRAFSPAKLIASTQLLSYVVPVITSSSLGLGVNQGSECCSTISSTLIRAYFTHGGYSVQFRGGSWGLDKSKLRVFYGLPPAYDLFECAITDLSLTSITCLTSPGSGGPYKFVVDAQGQVSLPSDFQYELPVGPMLTSVSGCMSNTNSSTAGCPTVGGTNITMIGSSFLTSTQVVVGTKMCSPVVYHSTTKLSCILPPGEGELKEVQVANNDLQSLRKSLISYAAPSITKIEGCFPSEPPQECSRDGGATITISGSNFGSMGATVYVGASACTVTQQEAGRITCLLPPGQGQRVTVVVQQKNGLSAVAPDSFGVSYATCKEGTAGKASCTKCDPGYYSTGDDVTNQCNARCLPCPLGTYSDIQGATKCTPAPGGSFVNNTAMTVPLECPPGTYSSGRASSCSPCLPGMHNSNSRQVTCKLCEVGKAQRVEGKTDCDPCINAVAPQAGAVVCVACQLGFEANNATNTCDRCQPGRFMDGAGSVDVCSDCPPGLYMNNLGATVCDECPPGSFQNSPGHQRCEDCAPGTFQSQPGSDHCENCTEGTYSSSINTMFCDPCPPGTAAPSNSSVGCGQCLPGKYSKGASALCDDCLSGSFAPSARSTACVQCDSGKYCNTSACTNCKYCLKGFYASGEGATVCDECREGRYSYDRADQCLGCDPGRSSATNATTSCDACDAGKYADVPGLSVCLMCQKGSFASSGSITCAFCSPRTFAIESGASSCNECIAGYYVTEDRAICVTCPSGTYSNAQTGGCRACPGGQYARTEGTSACKLCGTGTFQKFERATECENCTEGRFIPTNGASACDLCEAGKFANSVGRAACSDCLTGTVQQFPGHVSCNECPEGRFVGQTGQSACVDCDPGTFANGTSQAQCMNCPAGSFSDMPAAVACRPCIPGTYSEDGKGNCAFCSSLGNVASPFYGSSRCHQCIDGSTSNAPEATQCMCPEGTYALKRVQSQQEFGCTKCLEGGDCTTKGTTIENLGSLRGWWRADENGTSFQRCIMPSNCVGGKGQCAPFRQGPLCAMCYENFQQSGLSGDCTQCEDRGVSVGFTVGASFGMLIVLVFVYWGLLRTGWPQIKELRKLERQREASPFRQPSDPPSSPSRTSSTQRSKLATTESIYLSESPQFDFTSNKIPVLSSLSRRAPSVMFKFKILTGFFQIITSAPFQAGVQWPSAYLAFIQNFQFVNFDFMPWSSLSCLAPIDHLTKSLIIGLVPIGLILLIVVFFVLPLQIMDLRDYRDEDTSRWRREEMRVQFCRLSLFTVFCMYPHVSATILNVYNCVPVGNLSLLVEDVTVVCGSERWQSFALMNMLFVLLYPIGIPLMYFVILYKWHRKRQLRSPHTLVIAGFLYNAFSDQMWYFELIDMAFKLGMTALIPFLPHRFELPVACCAVTLYITMLLLLKPYVRKGDDRMHLLTLCELYLFCLVGYIISVEGAYTEAVDALLSTLLISIMFALVLAFVTMSLRNCKKLWNFRQRKMRLKANLGSFNLNGPVSPKETVAGESSFLFSISASRSLSTEPTKTKTMNSSSLGKSSIQTQGTPTMNPTLPSKDLEMVAIER